MGRQDDWGSNGAAGAGWEARCADLEVEREALKARVEQLEAEKREAVRQAQELEVRYGMSQLSALVGDVPGCETTYLEVAGRDGLIHRVTPQQVLFLWEAYTTMRTTLKTSNSIAQRLLDDLDQRQSGINDYDLAIDPPAEGVLQAS